MGAKTGDGRRMVALWFSCQTLVTCGLGEGS